MAIIQLATDSHGFSRKRSKMMQDTRYRIVKRYMIKERYKIQDSGYMIAKHHLVSCIQNLFRANPWLNSFSNALDQFCLKVQRENPPFPLAEAMFPY
jgi:hypothetical protein